jgi:hypothetical protein
MMKKKHKCIRRYLYNIHSHSNIPMYRKDTEQLNSEGTNTLIRTIREKESINICVNSFYAGSESYSVSEIYSVSCSTKLRQKNNQIRIRTTTLDKYCNSYHFQPTYL